MNIGVEKVYCPNCGKEYIEGQNFCRYCGYSLTKNNNIKEAVEMQNNSVQNNNIENYKTSNLETKNNESPVHKKKTVEDENNAYSKFIDEKKRLTPKAIAIITITIVCILGLALLLLSIDVETQIRGGNTPVVEDTNNDFEINIPADEENSIYAKEPVDVENHAEVQIVKPVEPLVINEQFEENSELSVQEPVLHYAEEPHNKNNENHIEDYNEQDRNFEPQTDDAE